MLIPDHDRRARRATVRAGLRRGAAAAGLVAIALGPAGCALWGGRPDTLRPAAILYEDGERALLEGKPSAARESFSRIVERHPESDLAPVSRFLVGETYFREGDFEKAIPHFEAFVALYPSHLVADLGQYRVARSYFDQMPTLERDQNITARALAEFGKLVRQYPESRYAPDALVKMDACRLRLAEKELWVADYYTKRANLAAAVQRYDAVLKDYPRTAVAPQALYLKIDALRKLGRTDEADAALQRLVEQYPASEWSRRAKQEPRQTSQSQLPTRP